MSSQLTDDIIVERLKSADLRPTRQRIALARLLFGPTDRHVTAETLHKEAVGSAIPVSLATVYNTLHQFTEAGMLREVAIEGTRAYFDTNTSNHTHFYIEADDTLMDVDLDAPPVMTLPEPPEGTVISRVDVLVRLKKKEGDEK